jgi:hypothetical protein
LADVIFQVYFEVHPDYLTDNVQFNSDNKATTVPVHTNQGLPKGLLRKIIREDLELELDTFIELWNKHK